MKKSILLLVVTCGALASMTSCAKSVKAPAAYTKTAAVTAKTTTNTTTAPPQASTGCHH